jgi:protocatechuate 3,4-dioxygenase beta subunit
MTVKERYDATRRRFLLSAGSLTAALSFARAGAAQELTPTPACDDGGAATPPQTEGPFFKPRSPQRADLREQGAAGRSVELSGLVLTRRCRPLAGAVLDLWHADDKGAYDTGGFRYRGHLVTGADGTYRFRTIMPAVYTGRTRHYHFKVQAPGSRLLTTQLYFPNEPGNRRDHLFRRELVMRVADAGAESAGHLAARFDFVLDIR